MLTLLNFGALELEFSWFTILVVSPTLFTLELDSRAAHWSHMSPQLRTIPCVGIIVTCLAAPSYHHIHYCQWIDSGARMGNLIFIFSPSPS